MGADPAMGEYLPVAPVSDEARKHNERLPGMGGVFSPVNLVVYHYAANNPTRYVDPDGRSGWAATMWWLAAADGPVPVGDAIYVAGIFVELLIIGSAVDNAIDNQTFATSNPYPDRSRGPGYLPPGNRPTHPTGRGANAGPENIGDPGGLDQPGGNFRPPNIDKLWKAIIMGGALGATLREAFWGGNESQMDEPVDELTTDWSIPSDSIPTFEQWNDWVPNDQDDVQ